MEKHFNTRQHIRNSFVRFDEKNERVTGALPLYKIALTAMLTISAVLPVKAACAEENLSVTVNGNPIGTSPAIINGSVMLPMRAVFDAAGACVGWNGNSGTAVGVKGGTVVEIPLNSSVIYKNGIPVETEIPSVLVNDTTMVSVKTVSEALGGTVQLNDDTGTVSVLCETKRNPALTDFLENIFENTDIEMGDDVESPLPEIMSHFKAGGSINSYAFLDIDSDGEDELIISSSPEIISPNISDWWEGHTTCLSIWDCGADGRVENIFSKISLVHRLSYKQCVSVYNGNLYLTDIYQYGSSGEQFSERRNFKFAGGKLEKTKEIIFRELRDYMSEDKYNALAGGEYFPETVVERNVQPDGSVFVLTAYEPLYSVDGASCDRDTALKELNGFDNGYTIIFDPYTR